MMQINSGKLRYKLLLRGQRRTGSKSGDAGEMILRGSLLPESVSNRRVFGGVDDPSGLVGWHTGQALAECGIDDDQDTMRRCDFHEGE